MPMKRPALLMAVAGLLLILNVSVLAAERVALVIGNGAYTHVERLANPLNDAADISAALGRLGFAVTRLDDVGKAELERGLQTFMGAANGSEIALVFYAGHGIEVDKRNFLVPVNARLANADDVEFEAVPLALVMRAVGRASDLGLVILDACRDNPFVAAMRRRGSTRAIGRGLTRVEPAEETLVAYAAKGGTQAADGEGRNSPYTTALLRYLEEPGLEIGLMFRRVRDAVLKATGGSQEPFTYGSLSSAGVYLKAAPPPSLPTSPAPVAEDGGSDRVRAERLTVEQLATKRLATERELLFWESVKDSRNAADIQAYLDHYPAGTYEVLARNRLAALQRPEAPSSASQVTAESMEGKLELSRADRRLIQLGLAAEGYDPGPADGLFGRGTRGAIGRWQASQDEEATGYLDVESAKVLLAAGRAREQEAEAAAEAERLRREQKAARQAAAESERLKREQAAQERAQREAEERARREAAEAERQRQAAARQEAEVERQRREREAAAETERLKRERAAQEQARREAEVRARRKAAAERSRRLAEQRQAQEWERLGLVMVRVDSGSFTMGCQSKRDGVCSVNEKPAHQVQVGSFEIGKYEVTQMLWELVMGKNPSRFSGCAECPVERVSWDDVQAFLAKLNARTGRRYRLPSEAEWEYAARGGRQSQGYRYAGSNEQSSVAWYKTDDSGRKTYPVGQKRANELGLHDMSGNVQEWIQDCWNASYDGALSNGHASEGGDCGRRVARGGSWSFSPRVLRVAFRIGKSAGDRFNLVGFRLARTLAP